MFRINQLESPDEDIETRRFFHLFQKFSIPLYFVVPVGGAISRLLKGLTLTSQNEYTSDTVMASHRIPRNVPGIPTSNGRGRPGVDENGSIIVPFGEWTVGRSLKNDIVIRHASVSRRHAILARSINGLQVDDLNSRNGTFANKELVKSARLLHSDRITFGIVTFVVHDEGRLVPNEFIDSDCSTRNHTNIGPESCYATIDLSPARKRVLDLLLDGLSEQEIACRLGVARPTVHTQVTDIYRAFNVSSRAELMSNWIQRRQ